MNITKQQLESILEDLSQSGKSFHVQFEKADKTLREMDCRFGVKKHLKGGKATYNANNAGNIGVFEMGRDEKGHFTSKGYRCFNKDRVKSLKVGGEVYIIS